MFSLHFKDEVGTLRVFKEGSYEEKTPPFFSCTVHYISDTEVYMCNAQGSFTKEVLSLLKKDLSSKGYKVLRYEKRNIIKEIKL